ncbi:MHYT domain-containing protein [Streptomyces lushanensis]|uniref:MHYT domain-containing protein n=1 Tax=Streptomyces lushanensis TaxID=1434255 RepID=UPI00099FBBA5|nr:MHYT domain-containing protein [Streptomyces lushanensis]
MQGTVDGFNYGAVTPVAAFLMACLGSALGLRCTTRSLRTARSWRTGWLALGAMSIGAGIWTMHFIAMLGFRVEETPISYDMPVTLASLAVAVVVVGIGVFIVGYRGATRVTLLSAGAITGLGVAAMHYLGMSGIRLHGTLEYSVPTVVLSVVIAVVAATAALWAAVSVHGFLASLGASMVMGVAVTGMHYTGMAAVTVQLHNTSGAFDGGNSLTSLVFPMLLGPIIFLVLAGVVVMFDPLLVLGDGEWAESAAVERTSPARRDRPNSGPGGRPGNGDMSHGPWEGGRRPVDPPPRRDSPDVHNW